MIVTVPLPGLTFHCIFIWISFDQIRQFEETVGAGIEIRLCTLDILACGADIDIAVVILVLVPGDVEQFVDFF